MDIDAPARALDLAALGIDRSNWRDGRNVRASFRSVASLLPVDTIPGGGDVLPLPDHPEPLAGVRVADGDGMPALDEVLRRTDTDALVVLRDGRVALEWYGEGMTGRTPHLTMSVTKSVTGLVGAVLHASGTLDLDAPASEQVPEVAGCGYRGTTTRQLLDMRANIVWDAETLVRYRSAANWEPFTAAEAGFGLHAFIAGAQPGPAGHGAPFDYVSSNSELAAWVFERATGRRFATLVSDLLWRPVGAQDAACITVDRMGAARCSGGLCATARDLARLGQVMVDGGVRDGRAVLPRAALDDIGRGGDRDAWRRGRWGESFFLPAGAPLSYRSGWYVVDEEPATVFAVGTHGQHLFLDPGRRLVVVKLSSQAVPIDHEAMALTRALVAALSRLAEGCGT